MFDIFKHWLYRKNLSELDDIQRYFSRKLSTPTFPSMSQREEAGSSVPQQPQEERRDSDTDAQQLLLKTSRLVGEVNSIISGGWCSQYKHNREDTLFDVCVSRRKDKNESTHQNSFCI